MSDADGTMTSDGQREQTRNWRPCLRPCNFDEYCCRNIGMEQMDIAGPATEEGGDPYTIKVMVTRGSELALELKAAADHGMEVAQQIRDAAPARRAEDEAAAAALIATHSRGKSYNELCATHRRLGRAWKASLDAGTQVEQRRLSLAQSIVGDRINVRLARTDSELRELVKTFALFNDGQIDLDPNGGDEVGRMLAGVIRAILGAV